MIVKDLKVDLSEAAQNKLKEVIAEAVESKLQKEVKKIARRITVRFIVSGVALAGICLIAGNSDKIVNLVKKSND